MENRVGDHLPSSADIDTWVQGMKDLKSKLELYCVDLTAEERQRVPKLQGGGEEIARLVGKLLGDHGITLPDVSAAGIEADLTLAARLAPVRDVLTQVLQTVNDTMLEAYGEAWWAATAGYTALSRMSGGNARLESDLKPAREYFRRGKTKKKGAATSPAGGGTAIPSTGPTGGGTTK